MKHLVLSFVNTLTALGQLRNLTSKAINSQHCFHAKIITVNKLPQMKILKKYSKNMNYSNDNIKKVLVKFYIISRLLPLVNYEI